MELQVPYSVCAEIPKEGVFRRKTPGDKRNIEAVMSVEGGEIIEGEVCLNHIHIW